MISQRLLANLYIAIDAVVANKIRSLLTALGIIFGVAAVIAMLAIGNGAQQEILEQIKLVGVNNIVIKPIIEQQEEKIEEQVGKREKKKFSPGLTVRDVKSIESAIPGITMISPEIVIDTYVIRNGFRRSAKLVGVDPDYFDIFNFELMAGQTFNEEQQRLGSPVCIIGYSIKAKFFPTENPIGKSIKVGQHWLTIIGLLNERIVSSASISKLGIRDFNMDVYLPLQSVLIRYKNRDKITAEQLRLQSMQSQGMVFRSQNGTDTESDEDKKNYHQLDRLVIQVGATNRLSSTAEIISRLLERKHYGVVDYEIEIPELLLKQQQRTNDIFNYVLFAIACISLLVGGIGIMNIMLASVLERIKEIGLRLSIGAKKSDVVQQFLFEAIMISVSGGIIGVVLGISMAYVVSEFAGIPTIITLNSIILSFGVAATVGLIFGIAPAREPQARIQLHPFVMNKVLAAIVVFWSIGLECKSQNILTITDIIQRSKSQSPAFKQAETRRELSYWNYRFFKANYVPQIRVENNGSTLYRNSFTPITQPDGSVQYLQVNQFNPGVNIALRQPIQWTGGIVSVNTVYNYFRDIEENTRQWNGSIFNIRFDQPIFNYNGYKWDKLIEPILYEESKREYAEMMEEISRIAVDNFFEVLEAQVDQQIAEFNLLNNDTIYKIEQGRFNIGTTSMDKLLQVELQLLRSRQAVANAKLRLQTGNLELRTFIGLQTEDNFQLVLPEDIPAMIVNEEDALKYARETRADFIAFQRRKTEADQAVAQAKGNRYMVNVSGGFGLNNVGTTVGELYEDPARQQYINLSFMIPIIDWGRRKAMMQSAYAQKRLNDYLIAQDEAQFEQAILTKVRQFETLRLQIEITKKSDEVAFERYNVAQNRYLIGKIDITNLNIALSEKDDAKRSYLGALRSFWTSYFELRQLTLYDFAEQKYLYNPFEKE